MTTQRCFEDAFRKSNFYSKNRYHSQQSMQSNQLSKLRKNMHSNQSNYLQNKFQDKLKSIDLNEQCLSQKVADEKLQKSAKDINLPQIVFKQPNDCCKILLKRTYAKGFTNLAALAENKRMKQAKIRRQNQLVAESRLKLYYYQTSLGTRVKNQDRISIQTIQSKDKTFQYFGIFDGHGGYLTSNYLSLHLHTLVQTKLIDGYPPTEALKISLSQIEDKLRRNPRISNKSGSCALACLILDDICWIANVGDSRLLAVNNQSVVQVTRDHKPQNEGQKARIINNGGQIYRHIPQQNSQILSRNLPFRVYPGKLSVSRTIGDVHIKKQNSKVVIAEPEISTLSLTDYTYLLMLSDGVYQKLNNAEISSFFQQANCHSQDALKKVFQLAQKRKSDDNRSLIAIRIK